MGGTGLFAVVLLAVGAAATAGQAAPGDGASVTTVSEGVNQNAVRADLNRGDRVVVRRLTIDPGGSTGWHRHDGTVVAVVHAGTLTRVFEDCRREVSRPGQAVAERPGDVHVGRNLGKDPVILYVTYVLPEGSPVSVPVTAPRC